MECYENGILSRDDLDGVDLRWGNADAAIQMIHKIACREGIGNVLAEGVKRAAQQIGRGAERYAMHVKGQELPMHEPRGKVSVGLGYAISPTGADHMEADHDPTFEVLGDGETGWEPLGLLEPVDRLDFGPEKVRVFSYVQTAWNLYNSVGMCDFVGVSINALKLEMLRDYINAATGWNMSLFELMKVGERANTMYRLFNNREGFTAADDTLPDRLFEGLGNGHLQGRALDRDEFRRALRLYYGMAGWDSDGVPTPAKLAELGLTWAAAGVTVQPEVPDDRHVGEAVRPQERLEFHRTAGGARHHGSQAHRSGARRGYCLGAPRVR